MLQELEQELKLDWILSTSKRDGDSRLCQSFLEEPSSLEFACEDWVIDPYEGVLVGRDTFDVNGVVVVHIVFESLAVVPILTPKLDLVAQ